MKAERKAHGELSDFPDVILFKCAQQEELPLKCLKQQQKLRPTAGRANHSPNYWTAAAPEES